jgi:hypothetical protein
MSGTYFRNGLAPPGAGMGERVAQYILSVACNMIRLCGGFYVKFVRQVHSHKPLNRCNPHDVTVIFLDFNIFSDSIPRLKL